MRKMVAPLELTCSVCSDDSATVSVSEDFEGRVGITVFELDDSACVILDKENQRRLRDWLNDAIGDSGDADKPQVTVGEGIGNLLRSDSVSRSWHKAQVALTDADSWHSTPEGFEFWRAIALRLKGLSDLTKPANAPVVFVNALVSSSALTPEKARELAQSIINRADEAEREAA